MAIGALVFAGFIPPMAFAAEDRVILASRPAIESACRQLAGKGVQCKFIPATDIDKAAPDSLIWVRVDGIDAGHWLEAPPEQRSWYEKATGDYLYSQALIYTRTDAAGQPYSMARVVRVSHIGSNDPAPARGKEDLIWNVFNSELPSALADSEEARRYLASLDQHAAEASIAAAAIAQQGADQRAYEQSPAFKRQQLHDAAVACRKTIASARARIEHDDRVSAVSGYENPMAREQAAELIVECQDMIRQSQTADLQK